MRLQSFFIFFLLSTGTCFSQNEYSSQGARVTGMGKAGVCSKDTWSAFNNQAGLAHQKTISAGIYYENRFLLKELSTKAFCVTLPIKKSTLAISANSFGYSLFSKNKFGIAFAKMLGETFSVGIQADYFTTYVGENYGKSRNISAEIGMLYQPVKNLDIAFHIFNPTRAKLSHYNDERINTNLKLGAAYKFSDKLLIVAETEKEISGKMEFKSGLEYLPVKEFAIRVGMHTKPSILSFGFGLYLNKLKIDIASTLHPQLGISSHAGISYGFGN